MIVDQTRQHHTHGVASSHTPEQYNPGNKYQQETILIWTTQTQILWEKKLKDYELKTPPPPHISAV